MDMVKLFAHGEFPSAVYRAFTDRKYAEEFASGRIRFGNIYCYKRIEDEKRRDDTEGEAHVLHNGLAHHAMFVSNGIYVLCCHLTLDAAREGNKGKHLVKIHDPKGFAEAITSLIENSPDKYFGGVEGCKVVYTKGNETQTQPSSESMARWAYCQKPERFKQEKEFRFVIIRKSQDGDHLNIGLDNPADYLSLI